MVVEVIRYYIFELYITKNKKKKLIFKYKLALVIRIRTVNSGVEHHVLHKKVKSYEKRLSQRYCWALLFHFFQNHEPHFVSLRLK